MRTIDLIETAQTNLKRAKLRTFLTTLAVFIGTFTLAMTTALGEGVQTYIDKQTDAYAQPDTLIVFPKAETSFGSGPQEYNPDKKTSSVGDRGQQPSMTAKDVAAVKSLPNITEVYPDYSVTPDYIQYGSGKKYVISATSLYPSGAPALAAGTLPAPEDTSAILLPYNYLSVFGFDKAADAVGKTVDLRFSSVALAGTSIETKDLDLTIKGVLINSLFGQGAVISYKNVENVTTFQTGGNPTFFSLFAATKKGLSDADLSALKAKLDDKGYSASTYADQIASLNTTINVARLVLDGFSLIALLAATLGIVNTLLMAVLERTQEIGLMKALGMRRGGIFAIFTFEAMSIGFWGGLLGVLVAGGIGSIANKVLANGPLKSFEGFTLLSYPPLEMAMIVLAAMAIGLIAGALPALRASRLNPIDALRSE